MAHTLSPSTFRPPRPFREKRDDRVSHAMTGVINGTLYAVVFVWLPVLLALSQCAQP